MLCLRRASRANRGTVGKQTEVTAKARLEECSHLPISARRWALARRSTGARRADRSRAARHRTRFTGADQIGNQGVASLPSPLPDHALQQRAVRDAVEVAVLGAEGDGGVAELLDGALDAVYRDLVANLHIFLNVAAGGYVA